MQKLKIIITGATGMVGEGVLNHCLKDDRIESILSISRRSCNVSHPKLTEILHSNFEDLSPIQDQLKGYDACFFCLGLSSVGVSADDYYRNTYTLTLHVANTLAEQNPEMVFCYVSGASTDSTEKGRIRWARVKGKTENDLMKLPFKAVYNFRPGGMESFKGAQNVPKLYKPVIWGIKLLAPKKLIHLSELAKAMISVSTGKYYGTNILEIANIKEAGND
ncbi:NAD-dependent epimerase/dehydratase family protein [Niabella ginsengisoli]|uniref:NAD-dependent epimerase/dehydratase family protein n=1 Tax=Niabella ginsengisoli TaxID=522298 RepID=A0ABS9SGY4_9BACT|nr:NAD-dependent epimerase/dehydratase family protein [Niabella ginsengisoli]MCH5597409.1 NAD-dependent epimerase/dehydratase family protein [Niabella ginsengisoli]